MTLLNRAPTTIADPATNRARAAALDRRLRDMPVRVPPPISADVDVLDACGFCGRREVVVEPGERFERVTIDGPTVDDDDQPRALTYEESRNAADWDAQRLTPLPAETRTTVGAADATEAWLQGQVWSHVVVTRTSIGAPGGKNASLNLCRDCAAGLGRVRAVGPATLTALIADARPDLGLWPGHDVLEPTRTLTFAGRALTARHYGRRPPKPTRVPWEWITSVRRED